MPIINPTLPNDGEDIDAVDISGPILAILSVLNGNIDEDNLNLGSFTWAIMGTITNAIPVDAMVDAGNIRISRDETMADHVASGLVITADAAGSTLLYSMTAGVVYINGRRLTIAADLNRAATASRDTYIDVTDNLDGTASVSRNAVTNNNTPHTLAANSIRIGIVVSGAGSIAAAASINQGESDRALPIISSVAMSVSDSLGNLICNRNPHPVLIGYKERATSQTPVTTNVAATGLVATINNPVAGRKLRIRFFQPTVSSGVGGIAPTLSLYDGTIAGTLLAQSSLYMGTSGTTHYLIVEAIVTPAVGVKTYTAAVQASGAGATFAAAATNKCYLSVEVL